MESSTSEEFRLLILGAVYGSLIYHVCRHLKKIMRFQLNCSSSFLSGRRKALWSPAILDCFQGWILCLMGSKNIEMVRFLRIRLSMRLRMWADWNMKMVCWSPDTSAAFINKWCIMSAWDSLSKLENSDILVSDDIHNRIRLIWPASENQGIFGRLLLHIYIFFQ
jgi:hypothetical protein